MRAARHVAGDRNVVGLVGQDKTGGLISLHQRTPSPWISRVAADDSMWAKLKDVAAARNRWNAGFGRERPELSSVNFIVKDNMIDFVESKSRYFYWRLCDYEFLKLDLQTSKVPLAFFRKAIEGKTQQPLLGCRQMVNPQARDSFETKKPGRFQAHIAIEQLVLPANDQWVAEAERADRIGDLPHVGRIEPAQFAR